MLRTGYEPGAAVSDARSGHRRRPPAPGGSAADADEPFAVRRLGIGLLVTSVWIVVFFVVWRSTGITDRPCNDVVTIPVSAAACAAPGPSVFPALPAATLAALLVGVVAGSAWPRHGARPSASLP